jgi:hypothetical protein
MENGKMTNGCKTWEIILNEIFFNGQEDPENPVYLSEKKCLLGFSFSQS